jgi:hypothetical protein
VKGFGHEEIDACCAKEGITLQQNAIDEACNLLSLAGILPQRPGLLLHLTGVHQGAATIVRPELPVPQGERRGL